MPLDHNEAVLSLLDGPPLATFSPAELQEEVIALLGDDDPLAVALVIEEAQSRATEQEAKLSGHFDPDLEPCRLEKPCAGNEPLSGTGRCMTCGAQRRAIEPEMTTAEAQAHSDVEELFDPTGEEREKHEAQVRSDTEALAQPESKAEAPAAITVAEPSGDPLTARVKAALGLPDKDMAHLLGVARPTAQAYATGRLPEIIDGVRAEYMLRAVRKRLAALAQLQGELQTIVNVSD